MPSKTLHISSIILLHEIKFYFWPPFFKGKSLCLVLLDMLRCRHACVRWNWMLDTNCALKILVPPLRPTCLNLVSQVQGYPNYIMHNSIQIKEIFNEIILSALFFVISPLSDIWNRYHKWEPKILKRKKKKYHLYAQSHTHSLVDCDSLNPF